MYNFDKEKMSLEQLQSLAMHAYIIEIENQIERRSKDCSIEELEDLKSDFSDWFQFGDITDHIVEYYTPEEQGTFLRIFKDNAHSINDAYIEKCNDWCESDAEDDIFTRIQAGIWWKIRDHLYQYDAENLAVEMIENIIEEKMAFFNHINAILPTQTTTTKRGKL